MAACLAAALLQWVVMLDATAAEVFKWTDSDGHVHFGDHAPNGTSQSITIRSDAPVAANVDRQEKLRQMLDGYTKEREAREASQANAKQEAEKREQRCAIAKARQHSVENANFLYDYTAKGERRVLEGAEYKHAIEKSRQTVEDNCD